MSFTHEKKTNHNSKVYIFFQLLLSENKINSWYTTQFKNFSWEPEKHLAFEIVLYVFQLIQHCIWGPSGIIPPILFLRSGNITAVINISSPFFEWIPEVGAASFLFFNGVRWAFSNPLVARAITALLEVQNPLLKSLPCPLLDTNVPRQPLWPTCAQGEGALCDTWETKEQSQELNRQHHTTKHMQPRRDVQCLEAREAHGGPAGPDLCLIRLWHRAPLWHSILLIKVLAWLVACGCNKTPAIKTKAHGDTVGDSDAQGASCAQEWLCIAPRSLQAQYTAPVHSHTRALQAAFTLLPAWTRCLETHRDVPIPSYTDPTLLSPMCPSTLWPHVAHPAKRAVRVQQVPGVLLS